MSLPSTLNRDSPAGSDAPSTIDNVIRDFKLWAQDVFGLADDVAIATALGSVTADGLVYWTFFNTAGNPAAAGRLQRNGADLLFHDGTAARTLVSTSATQTLTNKTLTSPVITGLATTSAALTSPSMVTSLLLEAGANDYTLTWAAPAAARAISISDPGGTDVFVLASMTQTLANKTLTTPTIASFTNAGHDHSNAAGGGAITAAGITSGTLAVARGGTGVDGSTATNGQVLIGHDANNNFSLAALTAGLGIAITNGAGSISIATTADAQAFPEMTLHVQMFS